MFWVQGLCWVNPLDNRFSSAIGRFIRSPIFRKMDEKSRKSDHAICAEFYAGKIPEKVLVPAKNFFPAEILVAALKLNSTSLFIFNLHCDIFC